VWQLEILRRTEMFPSTNRPKKLIKIVLLTKAERLGNQVLKGTVLLFAMYSTDDEQRERGFTLGKFKSDQNTYKPKKYCVALAAILKIWEHFKAKWAYHSTS